MHKALTAPLVHLFASLVTTVMLSSAPLHADNSERVTLNMYRADVEQVLGWLAELRGLNILVDPRVDGELSIMAAQPVTPAQAESLVLSALDMYGYSISKNDHQMRITAAPSGGPGTIVESFTSDPTAARVIYVYWPKTVSAQALARLMAPLKGEKGFIQAFDDQALLLSDAGDRVKRLRKLAAMIDTGSDQAPSFFALKHADASAMATLLEGLFEGQRVTIAADEYSGTLLVSAAPAVLQQLETVIAQLDQRLVSNEETQVVELRFSQATELLPALRSVNERQGSEDLLKGRGHIEAVESANALILSGPTPWRRETLAVIEQLDQPRQQVLVESVIMEVSDGLITELGVEWNTDVSGDGVDALTRFGLQNSEIPAAIEQWTGAGLALGWFRNGSLRAVLRAAANDTGTRILSTPRLATLNHAPAEILVGSNIPVKTGEALVGGNGQSEPFTTIERKDIGIVLKVTPHINADDDVTLDIEQTVESLAPTSATDTDLITNKRQLKTRVRVENETVLVLGGLSSQENNEVVNKVPLLGDIPVMGALFRSSRNETVNRHLMVFIQPKLITDPSLAAEVSSEAMAQFSESSDEIVAPSPAPNKVALASDIETEWQTVVPTEQASADDREPPQSIPEPKAEPEPTQEPSPKPGSPADIPSETLAAASVPEPEPEPVYREEAIELDDQQAHITRSQGVRAAFVASPSPLAAPQSKQLPAAKEKRAAVQPKPSAAESTRVQVQAAVPSPPHAQAPRSAFEPSVEIVGERSPEPAPEPLLEQVPETKSERAPRAVPERDSAAVPDALPASKPESSKPSKLDYQWP